MKYALSAALVGTSIGLALPAAAADLPARPYTKAPAYVSQIYNWSGFYVGAHVGYAWGDEHDNLSEVLGPMADRFDVKGVIGGIHTGYNWQVDRLVFGLEGDFDGSGVKGSQAFDHLNFAHVFRSIGTLSFKSDWQASIRARAGYAFDNNWLLYVTGGVAFADAQATLDIARTNITACEGACVFRNVQSSDSTMLIGWTVGLGSEYALSRNWIARAEVRYTDFGSKTFELANGTGGVVPTRVRFDEVQTTVGISYKF